jgi:predicted nucleotidyltransferase
MILQNLQEAIERFRAASQADPRIVAAFVGGSLAAGTADEYSDLDLYLITPDEEYANFFAGRAAFMRQLGEPVLLEDFDGFGFDMVLFIFEDGIKGELALAKASGFLHIHDGPYRVLVDKIGLLKGVTFPVEQVPVEDQRCNLERLIKSFWRHLYLLTGALGRCWLLSAAGYFEGMRRQLLQVCRLSVDFADSGGHPSLETLLPAQLVAALSRTFFPLEREEIVSAAWEAVGLFQQVAKPLARAQGIPYPERLERVVLTRFETMSQTEVNRHDQLG